MFFTVLFNLDRILIFFLNDTIFSFGYNGFDLFFMNSNFYFFREYQTKTLS